MAAISWACQDTVRSGPADGDLAHISGSYLCGNSFFIANQSPVTRTVQAPRSGALAPPGPYLLFILNGDGVPSIAKVVIVT